MFSPMWKSCGSACSDHFDWLAIYPETTVQVPKIHPSLPFMVPSFWGRPLIGQHRLTSCAGAKMLAFLFLPIMSVHNVQAVRSGFTVSRCSDVTPLM